jgi:PAS domain S-box-containing protein
LAPANRKYTYPRVAAFIVERPAAIALHAKTTILTPPAPPVAAPGAHAPLQVPAYRRDVDEVARLALAADVAGIGVWDYEIADGRLTWDPMTGRIFGLTPAGSGGTLRDFRNALHPEDRQRVMKDMACCVRSCGSNALRFRIVRPDGATRWVEGVGRGLPRVEGGNGNGGATGAAVRIVGVVIDVTERKQDEALARSMLESSPNIIYLYSVTEQRYLYVSPQAAAILGYTSDEIIAGGRDWLPSVLHPDDHPARELKNERLGRAADGEVVTAEYRVRHSDGRWRYMACRNVIFSRLPNGRVDEVLGTVTDVTAQKLSEQALRQSETGLRLAAEAAHIGTWHMDVPNGPVVWSEATERIFGLEPGGYDGSSELCRRLLHPDDLERVESTVLRAMAEGGRYDTEFRVVRPDGTTRWVSGRGQALVGPDGRTERMVGVVIDVTDTKVAEDALRASEKRYRTVVENQTELVCHYLPDTTLTFVNEAYCRYFGRAREELLDRSFLELIPPEAHPEAARHVRLLLADPTQTLVVEHEVIDAGGRVRWQEWVDRCIVGADGRVVEFQGIGRDVTARHEAEHALHAALAEVGRLKDRLEAENTKLQEQLADVVGSAQVQLVYRSSAMREAVNQVARAAPNDATVLLLGETGTGKELFAKAVHALSPRKDRPYVRVNCGALPGHLIESELFGHERGAFTGAVQRRVGRFELADGGTLFLDEVGELPLELQPKLLRVLQEGELERVGGSRTTEVDVRIIAATNRDLEECVRRGAFRADLYYRLNVFPISVPPLRDRHGDIPLLAGAFLDAVGRRLRREFEPLSDDMLGLLQAYDWPGNVRELQNVIERAALSASGRVVHIQPEWLGRGVSDADNQRAAPVGDVAPSAEGTGEIARLARRRLDLRELERQYITEILLQARWRIDGPRGAAAILNLPPSTLRSRMKKLGIR